MGFALDTKDRLRHPEKRNRPDNPIQRKPDWIRVKAPVSKEYQNTRSSSFAIMASSRSARKPAVPISASAGRNGMRPS